MHRDTSPRITEFIVAVAVALRDRGEGCAGRSVDAREDA